MAECNQVNKRQSGATTFMDERNQYLAFTLGNETFAMDIRSIKEVIQYVSLTEVPLMPPFLRGVINLRGSVVPVIDLSVRFGRHHTDAAKRTCIVILEVPHGDSSLVLGTMVDHVSEVLEIAESDIDPAPSFGSDLRAEFIQGVGKVSGRFVIILDVSHVLSVEELSSLTTDAGRMGEPDT